MSVNSKRDSIQVHLDSEFAENILTTLSMSVDNSLKIIFLNIYTWKKVREHPDQFQSIFSLAKYYVFIFICDTNGLSYIN